MFGTLGLSAGVFFFSLILSAGLFGVRLGVCLGRAALAGVI